MERLLSPDAAEQAAQRVWEWLTVHVLVGATLFQAALIAAIVIIAWGTARRLRPWLSGRLAGSRLALPMVQVLGMLVRLLGALLAALLLWCATLAVRRIGWPEDLLRIALSLAAAWVVIRLSTSLLRDRTLAKLVAVVVWCLAALNILELLDPALVLLDAMAVTVGRVRLSVLLGLKVVVALAVLLWLANLFNRVLERRLATVPNLTPAMQVLIAKLARILLVTVAVLVALGVVGIDLTALAVLSGAIGLGLGFGLQKVVSNLISGVILLLDRSIKPGDVIEIEGTYGWITRLNARYVSVVTRDNTEFLIPNEDLITHRVINWSYTNDLVRLHVPVGISYRSDPRQAIALCIEAVAGVPRALKEPAPVCLVKGFGDSSVDLELRFWISDPRNGTANVRSQVLLGIWTLFRANGIEIPYPQRDLHVRSLPPGFPAAPPAEPAPSG